MKPEPELLTAGDVAMLARLHERSAHTPLAQPFLLLALDPDRPAPAAAAWLRDLPAPVIGIGADDTPWAAACDVVVDSVRAAAPLIDNIRRTPMAAMVLVQLLRLVERLPLEQALIAESLAYATLQNGAEFRAWRAAQAPPPPPPAEDGAAVILTREGDTLQLALNRPANRNAMTVEMRDALCEALQLALCDPGVARLRIHGRGKCFSLGGDLREFGSAPDAATAHLVRSLALPGRGLAACGPRAEVFVHGACVGSGIEFPAFAGRVVAARDAWFQLPELKFGLIPGAGGCVSISRRIGRRRTAWLALSGRRLAASEALYWGLVDALTPAGDDGPAAAAAAAEDGATK
ncbi:enoyl-CoA hydratase/isomerase family protein [Solimonas soli]|uniref:enoyl-CoA hydratase/isomerase family protein n=1 Tax=Solimonas soli TaxID=413479 RepID=UPI0004B1BCE2|nr:enoyl-CoA hydratase/isomerase family protein [Solimonas soli]